MSMQTIVNNNLLKHAAGHAMFCPACQNILDWKRTVVLTVHVPNQSDAELIRCKACWKKQGEHYLTLCGRQNFTFDLLGAK